MKSIILPGLIDSHVHLRDPGQTDKEDFTTGTAAALAGGYTCILDMPNNKVPIITARRLEEKIAIAKEKIACDVGFFFGSVGDNLEEFEKVKGKVKGLKLYLSETTGNLALHLSGVKLNLDKIYAAWPEGGGPILVHAEGRTVEDVISVVRKTKHQTHFCHISLANELKIITKAKEQGLPVTCGVTPHHLFLTDNDAKKLGPFGLMKPPLRSRRDVDYLWKHLLEIDVIESDHAPHTKKEKLSEGWREWGTPKNCQQRSDAIFGGNERQDAERSKVPYGVPGLETTLPLLLTAVSEKKLTIADIIRLCHTNPAKIFGIKPDFQTKVEIDPHTSYFILHTSLFTKCRWSPFNGWKVKGKVIRVFLRGTKVFENGEVLIKPGFGRALENQVK